MIRLNANPLKKGHRLVSLALFAIGLIASTVAALAAGGARAGGSGTWAKTGSLTTARDFHTATLLQNGEVLVAGGIGTSDRLSSAELYDPAHGKWRATGNMNHARDGHTGTLLNNGQVLVAGGTDGGADLASAELYNPATGSWTFTGSMSSPRNAHTPTLLASVEVLVAGGNHHNRSQQLRAIQPFHQHLDQNRGFERCPR